MSTAHHFPGILLAAPNCLVCFLDLFDAFISTASTCTPLQATMQTARLSLTHPAAPATSRTLRPRRQAARPARLAVRAAAGVRVPGQGRGNRCTKQWLQSVVVGAPRSQPPACQEPLLVSTIVADQAALFLQQHLVPEQLCSPKASTSPDPAAGSA